MSKEIIVRRLKSGNNTATIKTLYSYREIHDALLFYKDRLHSLYSGKVKTDELARKYATSATVVEMYAGNSRIGFSAFYNNDEKTKLAYISTIAIASNYEGRGCGSMLLREVERICKSTGMECIMLETGITNNRAKAFYIKNGYIEKRKSGDSIYYYKEIERDNWL